MSREALDLLTEMRRRFGPRRRGELPEAREERYRLLRCAGTLDFLIETSDARADEWQVAAPRADYSDRRAEITGPTDRQLVMNALTLGPAASWRTLKMLGPRMEEPGL